MTSSLLSAAFTTPGMEEAAGDRAWLQGMLDFEAALAGALARAGVVPQEAADEIGAACRAERFDPDTLGQAVTGGGNPAIPLVKQLTAAVSPSAAAFVHWGATSQDVIDTGTMRVLQRALALLIDELRAVEAVCARMAREHDDTLMIGRTLLQQALPITFGLKAAGWHGQIVRARRELETVRDACLAAQLGGAVGTLASLGDQGEAVLRYLAEALELREPEMPWHTSRDRVVRVQAALGLTAGAMARVATDTVLMMQTEVGEFTEPAAGGSSTMPHKRNPVRSTLALAAAQRVSGMMSGAFAGLAQQHERAAGPWHAEWQTLFDMLRLTAAAVDHVRHAIDGATVDVQRMRHNLERTRGVVMAEAVMMVLARHIGRDAAHHALGEACTHALETDTSLGEVLKKDRRVSGRVSEEEINAALDPANYLGMANRFVERALRAGG